MTDVSKSELVKAKDDAFADHQRRALEMIQGLLSGKPTVDVTRIGPQNDPLFQEVRAKIKELLSK